MTCDYHAWMSCYVLLRDNPYMAKTDSNGRFEIRNLPVGEHVFRFWHERIGYVPLPDIPGATKSPKRNGRVTIGIRGRTTKLKDVSLPAKLFEDDE